VKLNTVERLAMNNPVRAAHQHHREAAWFAELSHGDLRDADVLEVGCGRGVGVEVLLDRLGARHVTAFDLDPAMVERADGGCGIVPQRPCGSAPVTPPKLLTRPLRSTPSSTLGSSTTFRSGSRPSPRSRGSSVRVGVCCSRRFRAMFSTVGCCAPSPSTPEPTASRPLSSLRSSRGMACTAAGRFGPGSGGCFSREPRSANRAPRCSEWLTAIVTSLSLRSWGHDRA